VSLAFGIWPHPTAAKIASEALFVQNYGHPIWSHTWSLAVEEHFYICLVALLVWLAAAPHGRGIRLLPRIVASVLIACLAMRLVTAWLVPSFSFHVHLAPSHLRFDALAFGVLLSYWYHRDTEALAQWTVKRAVPLAVLAFVLLMICAGVPRPTYVGHTVIQTLQYAGHGCLLLLVVLHPKWQGVHDSIVGRLLQGIGRFSYSIYLWHMGVLVWSRTLIAHVAGDPASHANLKLAVYAALVIPVGILAARVVEMPILLLRDRVFPSRSENLRCLSNPAGDDHRSQPVPS
jgi:peptidoglycan/LPS O-acetylase OafA/YrhL